MKPVNLRIIIVFAVIFVLGCFAVFCNVFQQQGMTLDALSHQQKADSQLYNDKLTVQQHVIDHLREELEDTGQQIKALKDDLADQKDVMDAQKEDFATQKDALVQEINKRQQVEDDIHKIRKSVTDIRAEADAIKQDMKGWQKDYVTVLAEFEKKINDSQDQIKLLQGNLDSFNVPVLNQKINSLQAEIDKLLHPSDTPTEQPLLGSTDKIEHTQ